MRAQPCEHGWRDANTGRACGPIAAAAALSVGPRVRRRAMERRFLAGRAPTPSARITARFSRATEGSRSYGCGCRPDAEVTDRAVRNGVRPRMAKRMLIDATHPEETRVVVVNGTRLEEFDFETSTKKQLKGNI